VILGDPKMPLDDKEQLIRSFAHAIKNIPDYIVGPDMGTDEICMAWCHDITGRAVGLPREIGGIPLDLIGATGYGLCAAIEVASEFCDLDLNGATIVVQGFGSVGIHVSRFLAEKGAVLVGVADIYGGLADPGGLDVAALMAIKGEGGKVQDLNSGEKIDRDAVIDIECDVWIPAARPDVIRMENVDRLNTRIFAQGANIPASAEAEESLEKRGTIILPDFIANAGGVICGADEYHGRSELQAMSGIADKVANNTRSMLERARADGISSRQAAMDMALERVRRAVQYRKTT
jgi:glutamate dehydrogenase (NAD(P)+)